MNENKMGSKKILSLIVSMGIPMMISMVLQAVYNVVDTVFVINMGTDGTLGNLALSAAFPVQIMMIAIGVGTGIGINALLSKKLGEGDGEAVSRIAGNGLLLAAVFYILFLLFGIFLAEPYMRLMSDNATVIGMGTSYLRICCCISVGSIGYAIAERFLMATGRTLHSMLAQISGALTNIVLDYVFIYPLGMGIAGAAYATVIGQCVSLVMALAFHYTLNKEIDNAPSYLRPDGRILKQIYRIGFPGFLMQAMLSVMMFGMLMIIGTVKDTYTSELLAGSYGIYYKLMQMALFACFGLSNTLISINSFNYGMKDKTRIRQTVGWGLLCSAVVSLVLTGCFQLFASRISELFALTLDASSASLKEDILSVCRSALHISTLGYVFMGLSVAVQGILQSFGEVYSPLIISTLRLLVFVLPIAWLFTLTENVTALIWWTFPIAELLSAVVSVFLLSHSLKTHLRAL